MYELISCQAFCYFILTLIIINRIKNWVHLGYEMPTERLLKIMFRLFAILKSSKFNLSYIFVIIRHIKITKNCETPL